MSLEQSVAALTAQAATLLQVPQALADQFSAGRTALEAIYSGRVASQRTILYVNAVGGSDANLGNTPAQAVATLARAVALIPTGALGDIRLMSDINLTQQVLLYGRSLVVQSDSNVRRRLTFGREFQDAVAAAGRQSIGFRLGGSASLILLGLTLVIPPLDGNFVGVTPNAYAPMITSADIALAGSQQVTVAYCDVEQAATPFAALLGSLNMMTLFWFINTLVGAITTVNGRILEGVTSAGGTAPPTILRTNLTLI